MSTLFFKFDQLFSAHPVSPCALRVSGSAAVPCFHIHIGVWRTLCGSSWATVARLGAVGGCSAPCAACRGLWRVLWRGAGVCATSAPCGACAASCGLCGQRVRRSAPVGVCSAPAHPVGITTAPPASPPPAASAPALSDFIHAPGCIIFYSDTMSALNAIV